MDTFHNPDRFAADLRQRTFSGSKKIGLLVGAGAPLAIKVDGKNRVSSSGKPIIPGIDDLTNIAINSLKDSQLAAAKKIQSDLGKGANIEAVLSRIRLLNAAIGGSEVNGLDSAAYEKLGTSLCEAIGKVVGADLPIDRNAYTELVAWISGTLRTNAVEIFTTNYDLLFEQAFEKARAPYFDGFSGGSAPFFDPVTVAGDDLPPRWSRLWKLHGSIGWAIENGALVRGRGKQATQLVYPDHLKYDLTQKQPYSALFERLKRFLLTPDTLLLATGFSFRDAHICAVLDEALAMNANTAVIAFQYGTLSQEQHACRLAHDRPNLSVYASDGAVVSGIQGQWRLGELPKNWADVRASFWGEDHFLLGDFAHFSRFCALAQASDIAKSVESESVDSDPKAGVTEETKVAK